MVRARPPRGTWPMARTIANGWGQCIAQGTPTDARAAETSTQEWHKDHRKRKPQIWQPPPPPLVNPRSGPARPQSRVPPPVGPRVQPVRGQAHHCPYHMPSTPPDPGPPNASISRSTGTDAVGGPEGAQDGSGHRPTVAQARECRRRRRWERVCASRQKKQNRPMDPAEPPGGHWAHCLNIDPPTMCETFGLPKDFFLGGGQNMLPQTHTSKCSAPIILRYVFWGTKNC